MTNDRERLRRLAEFLASPDAELGEPVADEETVELDDQPRLRLDVERVVQRGMATIHAARRREPTRTPSALRRWISKLASPRLSLALNVVLLGVLVAGSVHWNPFARFSPRVELTPHEVIIYDAARGKADPEWRREFQGTIQIAKVAPWNSGATHLLVAEIGGAAEEGTLHCFDFRKKVEVWQRRMPREDVEPFFGADLVGPATFRCRAVEFVDLEGNGEPEVMATFLHEIYLPCAVRTFSKDGRVLGTYLHWGLLGATLVTDLDEDGREELVLGGTDNAEALQGAAVVVLDRDHLSGASVDRFIQRQGFHDGARYRLILPQFATDLMQALNWDRLHVFYSVADRDKGGRRMLRIAVGSPADRVTVLTDAELRPREAILSDAFIRKIRVWVEEGKVTTDLTKPETLRRWLNGHYRFEEGRQVYPVPDSAS